MSYIYIYVISKDTAKYLQNIRRAVGSGRRKRDWKEEGEFSPVVSKLTEFVATSIYTALKKKRSQKEFYF